MSLLKQILEIADFLRKHDAPSNMMGIVNKLEVLAKRDTAIAPTVYFIREENSNIEYTVTKCPICGHIVKDDSTAKSLKNRIFCEKCGQKFD